MEVPPEVAFRNVEPTEALKQQIAAGIESLEEVYDRLTSCRVMVEETNPGRKSGKLNHVRLDVTVPGHEIVVNRKPPEHPSSQDLPLAVDEAFEIARRQLVEFKRRRRGNGYNRELPPHGRIVKLVEESPEDRYGFLMTSEGKELYFHQNSVLEMDFDDLEVGMEVRFAEEQGDKGPQASTVAPLDQTAAVDPDTKREIPL